MATFKYTSKDIQRFWSKVAFTANPDKCWEWIPPLANNGYGQININHKIMSSHRVAWVFTYGEIVNDLWVLHSCDNRACCNPKHLFLGTNLDNILDMRNKGRDRRAVGEQHSSAKLTWILVREIRQRFSQGGISHRSLGREYNVSYKTIGRIVKNEGWYE
jgi:HNH endonuclease